MSTTTTRTPKTSRTERTAERERGAVTSSYEADREKVLEMLNGALATELVCTLRYRRHHAMAEGLRSRPAAAEFLTHAQQELDHAQTLAHRIVQLGGEPDYSPAGLAERSHADYVAGDSLEEMIRSNLEAERLAVDSYRAMIREIGDGDPTTRRLLEDILAVEEEHADDMAGLLDDA